MHVVDARHSFTNLVLRVSHLTAPLETRWLLCMVWKPEDEINS